MAGSGAPSGWREIPAGENAELGPGRYRIEVDAPAGVLDFVARNRDLALSWTEAALQRTDRRVEIDTGGVQHNADGSRSLVLGVHVRSDDELPPEVIEAGISPRAVWQVGALLTVWAGVIGINYGIINVRRVLEEVPDEATEDVARGFSRMGAALALGVGAYIAHQAGAFDAVREWTS